MVKTRGPQLIVVQCVRASTAHVDACLDGGQLLAVHT